MTTASTMPAGHFVPRKAVIALGFDVPNADAEPVPSLPYGALAERLPAVERQGIQQAVEEVLSAGLMELVFLTPDGAALAGEAGHPQHLVVTRSAGGTSLGMALCSLRTLIAPEPFVVLAPERLATVGRGVVARLLAAYRHHGGNLAVVDDGATLQREGTFAALSSAATGPYLLQPEVLSALEDNGDLAAALLALAEAWPVTALPLRPVRDGGWPELAGVAD